MKIGKLFFLIIAVTVGFGLITGQAIAGPQLNWGSELNAGQCPDGDLVINVTHKVVNGLDSGVKDWWAFVDYNRTIQVWQTGEDKFCALVKYKGHFITLEGSSPMNTDADGIAAGIKGTFRGGYRMIITGTLKGALQTFPWRGTIGTFDFECVATNYPDHSAACPGIFVWQDEYFETGYVKKYEWWGWKYHAGKNGTWVNSSEGNTGDITD